MVYQFQTKKEAVSYFKAQINADTRWLFGALHTLMTYQTDDEKLARETIHHNNKGFQQCHARYCTCIAKLNSVRSADVEKLRGILIHYARQLVEHCIEKGTVLIERKKRG